MGPCSTTVLTLVLLAGAVLSSPLPPSDNPTLPAARDAAHVEVTHEVHHVTFEVSEEVRETTASSPGELPEDDPPIPTATTPPTTPEDDQQRHDLQNDKSQEDGRNDGKSQKDLPRDGQTAEDAFEEDGASVSRKEAQEAAAPEDMGVEDKERAALSQVTGMNASEAGAVSREAHHEPERLAEHASEEDVTVSDDAMVERESEIVSSVAMESSSPIDIVERSDTDERTLHSAAASEAGAHSAPGGTRILVPAESEIETLRKSRVYIGVPHGSKEPTALEKVDGYRNSEPNLANSGLQIMSMTSPTPESPEEGVPTEDLQGQQKDEEEIPSVDIETEATVVFVDPDSEENSTVAPESENSEEPEAESEVQPETESEVANEATPEATPEVVPEVPEVAPEITVVPEVTMAPEITVAPEIIAQPSATSTLLPGEEYTDAYNDPIDSGGLPDVDVTKEELPSNEYPQPQVPLEEPSHPQDQSGKVDGGDSSDLAASDHVMEVDAGTAWVLPPQQEQVSAVAPEAMTPGCIVGIVFGVLLSLVVLLGVGGFVIWQRRTLNRPKVLESDRGYAGSDSGGYIDDQVRVSYVNSQIDTPKGQAPEASQSAQAQQIPQVLIHLKSLKPSLPQGMGERLKKSLPTMPKIVPVNLPNVRQVISKRQSGGSNQPGQ